MWTCKHLPFQQRQEAGRVSVVSQVILDCSLIRIAKKGPTLCFHSWGRCSRKQSRLMTLGRALRLVFLHNIFFLLIILTWENTLVWVFNSPQSHSVFEFFRMSYIRISDQLSLTVRDFTVAHFCLKSFLHAAFRQTWSLEACAVCFQNHYDTQTRSSVTILLELTHHIHTLPQTL